jgi:hypothetical protein
MPKLTPNFQPKPEGTPSGTPSLLELRDLWTRLIGNPPEPEQFVLWMSQYSSEVIKNGIVKTAIKNLKLHGQGIAMSEDHRRRFASKVMWTRTHDLKNRQSLQNPPAAVGSQGEYVL